MDVDAITEEEAREGVVKKWLVSDRKKAEKLKKAEEKAEHKEKERLKKAAE